MSFADKFALELLTRHPEDLKILRNRQEREKMAESMGIEAETLMEGLKTLTHEGRAEYERPHPLSANP